MTAPSTPDAAEEVMLDARVHDEVLPREMVDNILIAAAQKDPVGTWQNGRLICSSSKATIEMWYLENILKKPERLTLFFPCNENYPTGAEQAERKEDMCTCVDDMHMSFDRMEESSGGTRCIFSEDTETHGSYCHMCSQQDPDTNKIECWKDNMRLYVGTEDMRGRYDLPPWAIRITDLEAFTMKTTRKQRYEKHVERLQNEMTLQKTDGSISADPDSDLMCG